MLDYNVAGVFDSWLREQLYTLRILFVFYVLTINYFMHERFSNSDEFLFKLIRFYVLSNCSSSFIFVQRFKIEFISVSIGIGKYVFQIEGKIKQIKLFYFLANKKFNYSQAFIHSFIRFNKIIFAEEKRRRFHSTILSLYFRDLTEFIFIQRINTN